MRVAVVASEAVPFAKTGGLADVIGALPPALERLGHQVTLFLPCYRQVWDSAPNLTSTGLTLRIPVGTTLVEGFVHESRLPNSNVAVYVIDQPRYFDRDQLYQVNGVDYPDNSERFIFFDRAVLETIHLLDFRPDVIHGHDWQTGLIPAYLAEIYRERPYFGSVATAMTIHNLAYQGVFWHGDMSLTGLDWNLFNWRQLEHQGKLNFLKSGLAFADILSTVSPTYAQEIQTPQYGCGLDGLLRSRRNDLRGIVNGIDTRVWNPSHEPMLAAQYDAATVATGKAACKAQLQRRASLPERQDVPLFAQIGRLDPQKGWDLLAEVADDLLRGDVQLVVLGEGQPRYQERLAQLENDYPGKVRAFVGFSDILAHQIEAGADLFLMPSLYEPCGLNQLYSLVHGTVPIVRATGGLADTIVDVTPETLADETATGFVFVEPSPDALRHAIGRALALWPDRAAWNKVVQAGMHGDWSWDRGARAYALFYEEARRQALAKEEQQNAMGVAV